MPGKTMILLQENTGHLVFLPPSIPAPLRTSIEGVVDLLAETFETLKANLQVPGRYDTLIDLTDTNCTRQNLLNALIAETRRGRTIDLVILGHGSNNWLGLHGESLTNTTIQSLLTDAIAQGCFSLNIRTVFMCNCYGSTVNDDWIAIGAKTSVGTYHNNYMPEPMTTFFLNDWMGGFRVTDAAQRAYNATKPFYAAFALFSPQIYSESVQIVDGDGNLTFAWEYSTPPPPPPPNLSVSVQPYPVPMRARVTVVVTVTDANGGHVHNAKVHVKNFDANRQMVPEKVYAENVVGSGKVTFTTTFYPGPARPRRHDPKLPEVTVTATGFNPVTLELGLE